MILRLSIGRRWYREISGIAVVLDRGVPVSHTHACMYAHMHARTHARTHTHTRTLLPNAVPVSHTHQYQMLCQLISLSHTHTHTRARMHAHTPHTHTNRHACTLACMHREQHIDEPHTVCLIMGWKNRWMCLRV